MQNCKCTKRILRCHGERDSRKPRPLWGWRTKGKGGVTKAQSLERSLRPGLCSPWGRAEWAGELQTEFSSAAQGLLSQGWDMSLGRPSPEQEEREADREAPVARQHPVRAEPNGSSWQNRDGVCWVLTSASGLRYKGWFGAEGDCLTTAQPSHGQAETLSLVPRDTPLTPFLSPARWAQLHFPQPCSALVSHVATVAFPGGAGGEFYLTLN